MLIAYDFYGNEIKVGDWVKFYAIDFKNPSNPIMIQVDSIEYTEPAAGAARLIGNGQNVPAYVCTRIPIEDPKTILEMSPV